MLKQNSNEEEAVTYTSSPAPASTVGTTRDIIQKELEKRISTFSNEELLDLKKQEETRVASEQKELWEQETQLRKESVALEESRQANRLAIAGALAGMSAGSGVLIYAMTAHSVEWSIPGVAIFAFGIAITSNRAVDAVKTYFGMKIKENNDETKRSSTEQPNS
jgi:hypothetical protein